jgi:branched-chain amino acid transport system substrate-binding protein
MMNIFCWNKAVPALMVGIAFFLGSCAPKVPVEKKPLKEIPVDQFSLAEAYQEKGDLVNALEAYLAYLQETPRGQQSSLAIHRTGEIYFKFQQYQRASEALRRLLKDFPGYEHLAEAHYLLLEALYDSGEYLQSKDEAVKWLGSYPDDPLKGEVLQILGNNFSALGDIPEAFQCWLNARKAYPDDIKKQTMFDKKLEELIETGSVEDLERFAEYAVETEYAPRIFYRMAIIFQERKALAQANRAARSLVQSAQDSYWVSIGRKLLERIHEEMSVSPGVVGCLLPLSGPFAIYGEAVLNGIGLGIWDDRGQGQGLDLEVVIKDTCGDPEKAVTALEEMVNKNKVVAVIGPLSSKTASPAAKRAQELGVPIITLTQKEGITQQGDMVFRNFLTPSMEVKRLLDMAVDEMGIKRFAILYPDNPYGHFLVNLFWEGLEERGAQVTAVELYDPDQTDFAVQIKKMTGLYYTRPNTLTQKLVEQRTLEEEESELDSEDPEPIIDFEAVFIPDNFQRVAMIAPQLAYHDVLDVLLVGTSLWQSQQLVDIAADYVQDAIFPSGFFGGSGGEPGMKAFAEVYREIFGFEADILAAVGYDTISLLREASKVEDIRTRRDLQRALLRHQGFTGITGNIYFDGHGEIESEPLLLTISRKQIIPFR